MSANDALACSAPTVEEEASDAFVQRMYGEWTLADQAALEARCEHDPTYAAAYIRVEQSWSSLDTHAETPELMAHRQEAIAYARRENARRWLKPGSGNRRRWSIAAAVAGAVLALAVAWQLSPYGYKPGLYRTGIGEQRIVELPDRSRVTLDAATRMQVRFSENARVVELLEGQAQFSVANDSTRPFKVHAGERTIVALGTVFTVEYVDRTVHVALLEGKVAVLPPAAAPARTAGEEVALNPGEELRVAQGGRPVVNIKADLEAATAWREGKIIFRTEPLSDAVRRLNRYSRLQIQVADASLGANRISGVFEAGDAQGFLSAIERYYPIAADYSSADTVILRAK